VNAVEFDRVSRSYALYDAPADRLKEFLDPGRRSFHRDFLALDNVSFTIRRGEVFCVVGANGSGKSTTLKLLAGIVQPTAGDVRVNGRVAALLELGAGFNPEFSGRENVFLNGAILGFNRREMEARYAGIEAFADIGDFIDRPVKTYSSGMAMRLAFAVAIHVDPEILVVDEALAVGDTWFRHRCMRRVHEMRARGITIVFVSHSPADVRAIGDRVLWLDHGRIVALGDTETVLPRYLASMSGSLPVAKAKQVETVRTIPNIDQRHGDGRAEVLGIAVLNEFGEPVHLLAPESHIIVRISVQAKASLASPDVGFLLRNHLGLDFSFTSSSAEGQRIASMKAGEIRTIDFTLDLPELYPGAFSFSPWVCENAIADNTVCDWIDNALTIQMGRREKPIYGYLQCPVRVELDAPAENGVG
jgi:ABC-type polysaccharide/polyol phosphate transport system ATPase subunit